MVNSSSQETDEMKNIQLNYDLMKSERQLPQDGRRGILSALNPMIATERYHPDKKLSIDSHRIEREMIKSDSNVNSSLQVSYLEIKEPVLSISNHENQL